MTEEVLDWLPGWTTIWLGDPYMQAFLGAKFTKIASRMLWVGCELSLAGALPGASGNFSVRLGGDIFVITPQGAQKGQLTLDSLIIVTRVAWSLKVVRFVSFTAGVQPSSDTLLSHILYAALPDCFAVVHMHKSIEGPGVSLPYPVTQQEEVNPLVTAIRKGERAVNLLNHSPAQGGNGASIIVGEDMEETFQRAIRLAAR